jgi:hypothetical protein
VVDVGCAVVVVPGSVVVGAVVLVEVDEVDGLEVVVEGALERIA